MSHMYKCHDVIVGLCYCKTDNKDILCVTLSSPAMPGTWQKLNIYLSTDSGKIT